MTALERIQDLGHLELLMLRLPERVGSPLSLDALREDLQVSHRALASWIATRIRAVKKQQKHYHFDWSVVAADGARFENMVGAHLLKWTHFEQDTKGRDLELRYFRDLEGREVDFVVVEGRKARLLVECKWADAEPDRALSAWRLRSRF
ncbi:MAG: DUF4143 domain-containing protein [Betaproteobacteria bacterium]